MQNPEHRVERRLRKLERLLLRSIGSLPEPAEDHNGDGHDGDGEK